MFGTESNASWERFGKHDPYFGVWTEDRMRNAGASGPERDEFFASGGEHLQDVFSQIRSSLAPTFAPRRALDIGCGVGRVAIPLARLCDEVVGADISLGMLDEARRNCEAAEVTNVTLIESDDNLSRATGEFDFIHSFIVLQHIPPSRGEQIIQAIAGKLADDGVGAVHVLFASKRPRWHLALKTARRRVPFVNPLINALRGQAPTYPLIQMNQYNMNRLFELLWDNGFTRVVCTFINHDGYLGVMIYFRKD